MAKNILNMLLWHPEIKIANCEITYLHRGVRGNLKTISGSKIKKLEKGFMVLKDGSMVPLHRIIRIECGQKIIWNK
ncbi:MAG: RNA repair domain-containing protein [Methanobacteriaceae archaeon]|nr:RNA repair domain-containing protein [Methanobacteriaceae archaeon]